MSTTEDKPRTAAEKYVYDALRGQGVKYADLTDEQRARALAAPEAHPGLRGKSVARWIVDGETLGDQLKQAENGRIVAQADEAARRRSEAAKASGATPPKSEPRYPENVRKAVKRANELRGKSHGAGPKQHVHVRAVVEKELGRAPDVGGIVHVSGVGNIAELFSLCAEAPREHLKVLRPLAEKMGDDPWCKGRHLAAALAAWTDELAGRL